MIISVGKYGFNSSVAGMASFPVAFQEFYFRSLLVDSAYQNCGAQENEGAKAGETEELECLEIHHYFVHPVKFLVTNVIGNRKWKRLKYNKQHRWLNRWLYLLPAHLPDDPQV
jgi:hypothetical protein